MTASLSAIGAIYKPSGSIAGGTATKVLAGLMLAVLAITLVVRPLGTLARGLRRLLARSR